MRWFQQKASRSLNRTTFYRILAIFAALLMMGVRPASAIEIRETIWGFDGQVIETRFNLLSVFVDNPTSKTFDGEIRLEKRNNGSLVDPPIIESVYITPGSSRWVHFYPYVKSRWETWELTWKENRWNKVDVVSPRAGSAAVVLLDDPTGIQPLGGTLAVKRFREDLFPPLATATDNLAYAFLDHAPRWDPARQKSFYDWIRCGGRLYLLNTPEGRQPTFAGELQWLNFNGSKQRFGKGWVARLDRSRRELDPDYVKKITTADSGTDDGGIGDSNLTDSSNPQDLNGTTAQSGGYNSWVTWDTEDTFLPQLKQLSSPDHSWFLIGMLGVVYLASVFPGTYLVARKFAGDYRYTFGFLALGILLFSVLFLYVGRRGYNEVTVVHSIAIARQIPDSELLDVTQWSNAFVVHGGDYSIEHPGSSRLYGACQERERVQREIRQGAEARLLADIPPFSSRPFMHRALVAAKPIDLTVDKLETVVDPTPIETLDKNFRRRLLKKPSRELKKMILKKGTSFPADPKKILVLCGRRLYQVNNLDKELSLGSEIGFLGAQINVGGFSDSMASRQSQQWQQMNAKAMGLSPPAKNDPEIDIEDVYRYSMYPLLVRELDLRVQREVDEFVLSDDRVRLYVYAPLPETLRVTDPRFVRQDGYVLYSLDIFLTDAP